MIIIGMYNNTLVNTNIIILLIEYYLFYLWPFKILHYINYYYYYAK